jgi:hypothetical protein
LDGSTNVNAGHVVNVNGAFVVNVT